MQEHTDILRFIINGREIYTQAPHDMMLSDFLRDQLFLTGTKKGCGKGECGACTVIVNGDAVNSCMILLGKVNGAIIETIEGLEKDGKLHPLQESFVQKGAVQCGFCTPGMIMSAKALLDRNDNPSKEEIREALGGNICRCTGYVKIEQAVEAAVEEIRKNAGKETKDE
ncbi:MAG: (2Fe-2S)-binding protein [Christensenellaceae bacterium]|jgi:carbon-monoxide dehydrogenase small subunit|nr:(2Fe-2S)-binding protein [Christensenellaceae bacterium]